jgi:hypothetical protein
MFLESQCGAQLGSQRFDAFFLHLRDGGVDVVGVDFNHGEE